MEPWYSHCPWRWPATPTSTVFSQEALLVSVYLLSPDQDEKPSACYHLTRAPGSVLYIDPKPVEWVKGAPLWNVARKTIAGIWNTIQKLKHIKATEPINTLYDGFCFFVCIMGHLLWATQQKRIPIVLLMGQFFSMAENALFAAFCRLGSYANKYVGYLCTYFSVCLSM